MKEENRQLKMTHRIKLHPYIRRFLVAVAAATIVAGIYLAVPEGAKLRMELSEIVRSFTSEKPQEPKGETHRKSAIEVPVDITVVESEQKSVDAGHSPWKLDAAFVAQVFASLLISPKGIVGDYPIPYEDVEIVEDTGSEAVARINNKDTLAEYVYMKRLIRQDDTGIWTVVGYDPLK